MKYSHIYLVATIFLVGIHAQMDHGEGEMTAMDDGETDPKNETLIEGPPKFTISTHTHRENGEATLHVSLYLDSIAESEIYNSGLQGIYVQLLLGNND